MITRDPKIYPKDDGHLVQPSYRIFFRGRSRRIGDLNEEELRCALLDAQDDLDIITLTAPHLPSSPDKDAIVAIAWRHRTSRGEDEELDQEDELNK